MVDTPIVSGGRHDYGAAWLIMLSVACGPLACAKAVKVQTVHPAATLRDQLNTRLTSRRLSAYTNNALGQLDLRQVARRDAAMAFHVFSIEREIERKVAPDALGALG